MGEYVFHSAWGGGSQGGLGSEVTPELTLENDHPGCYTRHGARGREATAGKHAHLGGDPCYRARGRALQESTLTPGERPVLRAGGQPGARAKAQRSQGRGLDSKNQRWRVLWTPLCGDE